jgi:hypothetical protein
MEDFDRLTIKVVDIIEDSASGDAKVIFDVSDAFKRWFMQSQNLKRWSNKRFQKFFIEALDKHIRHLSEERNVNEMHAVL